MSAAATADGAIATATMPAMPMAMGTENILIVVDRRWMKAISTQG